MSQVNSVVEFEDEGFAIIKDTAGTYLATKQSDDIIHLYTNENTSSKEHPKEKTPYELFFGKKTTCALLQSRDSMMT